MAGSFSLFAYNLSKRMSKSAPPRGRSFNTIMGEWDIRAAVDVGSLAAPTGDFRTYGRTSRKSSDGETKTYETSPVSVKVGFTLEGMAQLSQALGVVDDRVRTAAVEVLAQSVERIKAESLQEVPYLSGDLHDAFFPSNDPRDGVYVDGDVFHIEVGYSGVWYAWLQHEGEFDHPIHPTDPRTGQHPKMKFLEDPANREESRMAQTAIDEIRTVIASVKEITVHTRTVAPSALGTITGGPRLIKKAKPV